MTNKTSELDEYFGPVSADEPELSNGNDQTEDDFETANDTEDLEMYNRLLVVFTNRLLAVASTWTPDEKAQRALVEAAIHGTIDRVFEKDGDHVEKYEQKVRELIAKKKASAHPQSAQPMTAAAPATKSEPTDQPQPIAPVANLDTLPEAPFSATVKIWHKVYGVEVLLTVRSTTVSDGIRRLDTMMDKLLGEKGAYQAQRQQVDAPSTANRRISADNAPPQSSGKPASAPVRSFDPDEGNKAGQVLHFESTHIEKVLTPKGKVEIRFYAPQPSGREPKYAELYVNLDSQLEEVYKHVDVEAMTLATRYDYPATIDYTLSKNKTQKGNPYKDLVAVHPKK